MSCADTCVLPEQTRATWPNSNAVPAIQGPYSRTSILCYGLVEKVIKIIDPTQHTRDGLMLSHRRRRWANIKPISSRRLPFRESADIPLIIFEQGTILLVNISLQIYFTYF